eukprot:CAMPEP_0177710966 /NCGR_PEP_ID=MMETSP0484_2-20121128/11609_1 /TAXON_ID=354590 /ORGANISM="Rhodomonas lens, Strain RHODO" /LENGTH=34 /DNA_ID= /DNA_START= /DNA_END= /DNA_ORIENTATION=
MMFAMNVVLQKTMLVPTQLPMQNMENDWDNLNYV